MFLRYVLSFVYLGIYWNNHHHMLHAAARVNGAVLWANLHLLFWLSLVPFATALDGREPLRRRCPTARLRRRPARWPAVAYYILQSADHRGAGAATRRWRAAIGRDLKGKVSPLLYAVGIAAGLRAAVDRRRRSTSRGADVARPRPADRAADERHGDRLAVTVGKRLVRRVSRCAQKRVCALVPSGTRSSVVITRPACCSQDR